MPGLNTLTGGLEARVPSGKAGAEKHASHQIGPHDADAARQARHDEHRIQHRRVVRGKDEATSFAAQCIEGACDAHEAKRSALDQQQR